MTTRENAMTSTFRRLRGFAPRYGGSSQQKLVLPVVAVVTAVLTLGPLAVLMIASFRPGTALPFETGTFTLENYLLAYASGRTATLVFNTLWYAGGSVLTGMVISTVLVWICERTDVPGKSFVRTVMFVGMAMPALVQSFGWILLLNPGNGAINIWLRNLFGFSAPGPIDVYSMWMMILMSGIMLAPTMFVMLSGVFRNMNPQLEDAALTAGAGRMTVLRRVTLPVLKPGILSVMIYVFIIMIQVFDVPLTIGLTAGVPVLSTHIYLLSSAEQAVPRYNIAAAFGVTLLLFALLLVWAYFRATRHVERYRVVTGKAFRPRPIELGRWRYPAFALVLGYIAVSFLPIMILAWTSLLPFYAVPSFELLERLSLRNYVSVTNASLVRRAVGNTLVVVLVTATVTMVLSCLISWFAIRGKGWSAKWTEFAAFTPLAVPQVVMALALLLLYAGTALYGTVWIIVLGLVIVNLAFGTRLMNAGLLQLHDELENAGTTSGASWFTTLHRITFPMLWPHVLNGWLGVLAHSLRDLAIPMMLMTTNNVVISSTLWLLWGYPDVPGAAALSMLMIAGLLVLIVPVQILSTSPRLGIARR